MLPGLLREFFFFFFCAARDMSSKTPTTVKELNVALADLSARLDVKNDQLKEDLKACGIPHVE